MQLKKLVDLLMHRNSSDTFAFDTELWKTLPRALTSKYPVPNIAPYYDKSSLTYSTVISISGVHSGTLLYTVELTASMENMFV